MILDMFENQPGPIKQLDPIHSALAHVEEDPKQDSRRDLLEDRRQQQGEAQQYRHLGTKYFRMRTNYGLESDYKIIHHVNYGYDRFYIKGVKGDLLFMFMNIDD